MDVYEEGARQWREFFARELEQFRVPELDPLGQRIVEACLEGAHQEDYRKLISHPMFRDDETSTRFKRLPLRPASHQLPEAGESNLDRV